MEPLNQNMLKGINTSKICFAFRIFWSMEQFLCNFQVMVFMAIFFFIFFWNQDPKWGIKNQELSRIMRENLTETKNVLHLVPGEVRVYQISCAKILVVFCRCCLLSGTLSHQFLKLRKPVCFLIEQIWIFYIFLGLKYLLKPEVYSETCPTSKIESFLKKVNG